MQWCFQIKDYFLYFGDCSVFTTERNDGKHYKKLDPSYNNLELSFNIWSYDDRKKTTAVKAGSRIEIKLFLLGFTCVEAGGHFPPTARKNI